MLGADALQSIARLIAVWRLDPVKFVRDNFGVDPDPWQIDVLKSAISGDKRKYRISMQACAGPGKSAVIAWLALWFLSCFGSKNQHPQGLLISMSKANLMSGLWKETSRWGGASEYLQHFFTFGANKIAHKKYPLTWFLEARTWSKSATPEEQGESLSGIHSPFLFYGIDEGGAIPTVVSRRAEQGMGDVNGMGWIVTAGNPMSKQSLLYEACLDPDYTTFEVTADPEDPKRTPRISVEFAAKQIKRYGRDDPWVKVFILAQFPEGGMNQFLSDEEVDEAMARHPADDGWKRSPIVMGLDCAGDGLDPYMLARRQGLVGFPFVNMGVSRRGIEIAADIANIKARKKFDAIFVDNTGGYGQAAIEGMQDYGIKPIPVKYNAKDSNSGMFNVRTGNYWRMAEWVKNGGCLPADDAFKLDLITPTYAFKNDQLLMEPKDMIRSRMPGGRSIDRGDCFSQTFTAPVSSKDESMLLERRRIERILREGNSYQESPFGFLDDYR